MHWSIYEVIFCFLSFSSFRLVEKIVWNTFNFEVFFNTSCTLSPGASFFNIHALFPQRQTKKVEWKKLHSAMLKDARKNSGNEFSGFFFTILLTLLAPVVSVSVTVLTLTPSSVFWSRSLEKSMRTLSASPGRWTLVWMLESLWRSFSLKTVPQLSFHWLWPAVTSHQTTGEQLLLF